MTAPDRGAVSGLIERLKDRSVSGDRNDELSDDAADSLARLTARVEELERSEEYAVGRAHDAEARVEELEAALRSVDLAIALSRAAHEHMHARGLDCPHDIGIVLAEAARDALARGERREDGDRG